MGVELFTWLSICALCYITGHLQRSIKADKEKFAAWNRGFISGVFHAERNNEELRDKPEEDWK